MNDAKGVWPPPPTLPPPAAEVGEGIRRAERACGTASLGAGALGLALLVCPNVALAAQRWGVIGHVPLAFLTQLTVLAAAPLLVALFAGMYGHRTWPGRFGLALVFSAVAFMLLAPHAVFWPDHSGARF